GRHQLGTREPAVAAHREGRGIALAPERAERAPDLAHDRGREALAHDAADVVGAEDFAGEFHVRKNSSRRRASHAPRKPTWPPVRGNSSNTPLAALAVAASSASSGRQGSLRALIASVGTWMRSSQAALQDAVES